MPTTRYQFFTPANNRLLVVLGFIALFALTVWWMGGVPKPSETNRVNTLVPAFSMVHPPDWDVDKKMGDERSAYITAITTSPKRSIGREIRLFFGEYKKPLDQVTLAAGGYQPITFQDQPAEFRTVKSKYDFTYMLIFARGSRNFEISIRLPLEDDVPKSEWWPYFQSFRLTPRPATTSTTKS